MTIREASMDLSYLKVTPVRLKSGTVMVISESEIAGNLLKKLGIPYPDSMMSGAQTKMLL